ncbi:MAG: cysteine hydrolase family protein [Thermoleophilaceae bacterium]
MTVASHRLASKTAAEEIYAYRRAMNDFTLDRERSALLVVDLQNGSCDPSCGWFPAYTAIGYGEVMAAYRARVEGRVLPNVRRLQDAFRSVRADVLFLTVGTITGDLSDMPDRFQRSYRYWEARGVRPPYAKAGTREMAVMDAVAPGPGEPVIQKTGYSGFTGTTLERVLFNKAVRQIVFCGVATDACVEATLRDAVDRGFDCVAVEDACAAATDESHQRGMQSMAAFARIATADEVMKELLGAS